MKSGPICPTKWFQLPEWPNSVGQLEPPCRTNGTALWDNWNHLVIRMKTLSGETSSCLGEKLRVKSQELKVNSQESRVKSQESRVKSQESRVKSQESRVKFKIRVRDKIQKSKVKKEIKHSNENTSKKNPAYGRHQFSRPMRIVGPIQIWRGCVIYLFFSSSIGCLIYFFFIILFSLLLFFRPINFFWMFLNVIPF